MQLYKLLEHFGVKSPSELNAEERKTYDAWSQLLNSPDPTLEDLKKVIPSELERVGRELRNYENGEKKQTYLQAYANVLQFISDTLFAPQFQREALRKSISERFNI